MSKRDKGRLPPFVPLLIASLDSPAWKATSHGAKALYVSLRRRVPNGRNVAYVSFRDAMAEVKSSKRKIADWFRELQHYGFIVLHQHGCLGTDGKGKAPHWRLMELGNTSKASADGVFDPPTRDFLTTRDFLKWDGIAFAARPTSDRDKWTNDKIKKQNPGSDVGTAVVPTSDTPPVPTSDTPQTESGSDVVDIETARSGSDVVTITSLTTTRDSQDEAPGSPPPPF